MCCLMGDRCSGGMDAYGGCIAGKGLRLGYPFPVGWLMAVGLWRFCTLCYLLPVHAVCAGAMNVGGLCILIGLS